MSIAMAVGNYIWKIKTNRLNVKGDPIFFNFRCAIETLEEMARRLSNGQFIVGEILRTRFRTDETGEFLEIIGATPTAIGPQIVAMLEVHDRRFVEWEE